MNRPGTKAHPMDLNALPARFFGTELRRLREHHDWTQSDLAGRTGFSDALVGYVENAQRVPTERFAVACDTAFDTGTYLTRLCGLARQFGMPVAPLRDLLASAGTLYLSDPLLVPSLAQTDDYARAVMAAHCLPDDTIDEHLAARARLSDLLDASPDLHAWIVIDETVLYRTVGSRDTLRRQLGALTALTDTRRVIVQVLKTTSPMVPLLRVPRTILGLRDGTTLTHLDTRTPDAPHEHWASADPHHHMFALLCAAALPPGVSRGAIANAAR